ncbi:uncharacterized protein LOC142984254 [Anticarsia gemmatalis]|uniref:uncharacterized protein LOC142984254 n=1 Tax=Anticarsia gemmatalis TaxID=129554 RepID=UPI003F76F372
MFSSYLSSLCVVVVVQVAPLCAHHAATNAPRALAVNKKGEGAHKIAEYVDLLKENLRKNNDDYSADKVPGGDTRRRIDDSKKQEEIFLRGPPEEPDLTSSSVEDNSEDQQAESSAESTTRPSPRAKQPASKLVAHRDRTTDRKTALRDRMSRKAVTTATSSTTSPFPSAPSATAPTTTIVKQRPANAALWNHVREKNKNMREMASGAKIQASGVKSQASSGAPLQHKTWIARLGTFSTSTLTFMFANTRQRRTRHPQPAAAPDLLPLGPLVPRFAHQHNRATPHADQLDMAPASGAYIQDLRVSGRLCHRHVLWPEGPKYDSRGKIILMAFRSKYGKSKDFAATKQPKYVLPRCCNCCKKSVLGCQ